MKTVSAIWATSLVFSSITLAFFSFFTLDDIVEGVLIYIAQCLLFAGSVAGLPVVFHISEVFRKSRQNENKNN